MVESLFLELVISLHFPEQTKLKKYDVHYQSNEEAKKSQKQCVSLKIVYVLVELL